MTLAAPHIYNHGVREYEAIEVLRYSNLHLQGERGATIALGQTNAARYLKVIYRPLDDDDLLVITAYALRGKALKAYRRRLRRKGK